MTMTFDMAYVQNERVDEKIYYTLYTKLKQCS